MFCHNCGSIISDLADSCRHCGVQVQPVVTQGGGEESGPSPEAPPVVPPPPAASSAPPPAPAAGPTSVPRGGAPAPTPPLGPGQVFCRRCGAPNDEADRYCSRCGTAIDIPLQDPLSRALNPPDGYSWVVALLLACAGFTTINGLHRFYTGHILIGVIQLLTFGGCLIWTIIDIVLIATDEYRDAEGRPLQK